MTRMLYDLVKESKQDRQALQTVIDLFEPKLKKSLSLTKYEDREDLAQELKCTLIQYIKRYEVDSIPGFWDLKRDFEEKNAG
ncbi:helix-turn-helix domain-containing protein [Priestia koreensis]|uniref:helix-turn-helix domain-containing protein n=1 Tax=Priestia koreensis TaxID=284581 RepID=UPI00204049B9|nr:helix-turn-helix domain-containing protein [Priestia koreensis]MCM3006830.1 helix-turn-helix domain-containing protein [Priestia koreensis]